MPGALLEIERLVNRPVKVEHMKCTLKSPLIVEHVETLPDHAAHVEVQDKLVPRLFGAGKVPAPRHARGPASAGVKSGCAARSDSAWTAPQHSCANCPNPIL